MLQPAQSGEVVIPAKAGIQLSLLDEWESAWQELGRGLRRGDEEFSRRGEGP
jgi:hypothetical protein